MLQKIVFLAAVLIATMTLSACKKTDTDQVVVPTPVSTMSASISGKTFSTTELTGNISGSYILISGIVNSGTSKAITLTLSIPHYTALATYAIDTAASASYQEVSGLYTAKSGSITISTFNDTHVAGTFAFEAIATGGSGKSVTAGSFDAYR